MKKEKRDTDVAMRREANKIINWEQRRYEIAKAILPAIYTQAPCVSIELMCAGAIEYADELIKQLKAEWND